MPIGIGDWSYPNCDDVDIFPCKCPESFQILIHWYSWINRSESKKVLMICWWCILVEVWNEMKWLYILYLQYPLTMIPKCCQLILSPTRNLANFLGCFEEHVGRNSYSTFFDKCYDLLAVEDLRPVTGETDKLVLKSSLKWARWAPGKPVVNGVLFTHPKK